MKVTLPTISSGYLSVDALSTALSEIEVAFENTLSLDGSTPNAMEADLDMNGHAILNVETGTEPDSLVAYGTMTDYVDARASGLVVQRVEQQTAIIGQTSFSLRELEYEPGSNNLAVYVNGVRKFSGTDYTESGSNMVTFLTAFTATDDVVFVTNDFVSTIGVDEHTHVWGDIVAGSIPSYASRWPTYAEVTGKPTTFPPETHNHSASEITSGRLADARRGIYVQQIAPELGADDAGALHFW